MGIISTNPSDKIDQNSKADTVLQWMSALIVIALVSANIAASKIMAWPFGLTCTAGAMVYVIISVTDTIVTENFGYGAARKISWLSAFSNIFISLFLMLAIAVPSAPFYKGQQAFVSVLGQTPRIVVASLVAYMCSSFINSAIITKLKEIMRAHGWGDKWMILRTYGSSFVAQFFDSFVFNVIAFLFTMDFGLVWKMAISQWIVKVFIELVVSYPTTIISKKIKAYTGVDVVGTDTYSPFKF